MALIGICVPAGHSILNAGLGPTSTGLLKLILTGAAGPTWVAPSGGVVEITDGGTSTVNTHAWFDAIWVPEGS
jgi:hypothetical protein